MSKDQWILPSGYSTGGNYLIPGELINSYFEILITFDRL